MDMQKNGFGIVIIINVLLIFYSNYHEKNIKTELKKMRKYKTILADPPWPIKWKSSKKIGKKHLEYSIMTISEICELPVYKIADEDCTLFLWTTNYFLPEALGVLRHWKFQYKMLFTWCKNNGMGGKPRNATEHMVIALRGEPKFDRHSKAILNWIELPRTVKHSQKPDKIREMVEEISPNPRIELFARQKTEGWDVWGNEVESNINLKSLKNERKEKSTFARWQEKGDYKKGYLDALENLKLD